MWVYRAVTYFEGKAQKTRFEVGYVAVRDGEEYGNGAYFHPVEAHTDADSARRAVHFLNGGRM